MLFVLLHRNMTHVSVSIHTSLAWNPKIELRCFPLVILQMFLQLHWTPSVVNSVDWTWFGKAHACLYKVPCWRCMSEHKPGVKSKESSANLPDRFVWRRRSGEGYRNSCFKGFSECSTLPHSQAESHSFPEMAGRLRWSNRTGRWDEEFGAGPQNCRDGLVQKSRGVYSTDSQNNPELRENTVGIAGALSLERSEVAGRFNLARPWDL